MLKAKLPPVSKLTAIYDEDLERITGEVSRIAKDSSLRVEVKPSRNLTAKDVGELLGRGNIHVLLHGIFDTKDPLQSRIRLNNPKLSSTDNEITAAELLAVDWRGAHLAVFSSCEGAMINTRISNEVYGLCLGPAGGRSRSCSLEPLASSVEDQRRLDGNILQNSRVGGRLASAGRCDGHTRYDCPWEASPFFWAGPQVFGR